MADKKKSLREQIARMAKGKVLVVSIDDYAYSTVRNYAADFGFRLRRSYSTHADRQQRTITITRNA